jgi:transcriptional regulator with XRE-family HTH domain
MGKPDRDPPHLPEKGTIMKQFGKIPNPREIRRRRGMNQQQFWGSIGVTQSGGSRYESGRNIPKPVRELLRLVHVDQIDLSLINKTDLSVLAYLKATEPELFARLKARCRQSPPAA